MGEAKLRQHDIPVHERIDALATRVNSVEAWMEGFKLQMTNAVIEMQANTAITEQTQGRMEEIYEFLAPARNFFRALGSIGNFGVRVGSGIVAVIEFIGRLAKPLFWTVAAIAGAWAWWKTGTWTMPEWWGWFR